MVWIHITVSRYLIINKPPCGCANGTSAVCTAFFTLNIVYLIIFLTPSLLSCPGVFTPSEAFTALDAGADLLKLFPAGRLVPEYIKDLKAVVPAEFIATGAVNANSIKDYLKFAIGAGIGSAIYKPGMTSKDVSQAAENIKFKLN